MQRYEEVFQKGLFGAYALRVRAAETEHEGDTRVKLSVVRVTQLNYAQESKILITNINKYLHA